MEVRVVKSGSAEVRLSGARRALARAVAEEPVLVLAATRHAARRLTLEACGRAAFGWRRATLRDLAGALSEEDRQALELVPASSLVGVALVERAIARLTEARSLGRFDAVARSPGLARAVWALTEELAADEVTADELETLDLDLASLLRAADGALTDAKLERPSRSLDVGAATLRAARARPGEAPFAARLVLGAHVVALDVALRSKREARLFAEVAASARSLLATVPVGDDTTLELLELVLPGVVVEHRPERGPATIVDLQVRLFDDGAQLDAGARPPPLAAPDAERLVIRGAAGEGGEATELVREVLRAARGGVALDRIAILVRSSASATHVLEALRRGRVPASPSPSLVGALPEPRGRAFLALLACASEGLSATRFAEYLSFGEVPVEATPAETFVAPSADESPRSLVIEPTEELELPVDPATDLRADVVRGALRAPRRWEQLLSDAAVVGGLSRWRRRLSGLRRALELEVAEATSDEERDPPTRRLDELGSLERFALPVLEQLAELPEGRSWGEWISALQRLARASLRAPERVLERLAELHPLADLGPVGLDEVRSLLDPRLRDHPGDDLRSPFGAVFVAPIEEARGLSFDVVLVPGLAERTFPERIVPEPLLSDGLRRQLRASGGRGLATLESRSSRERLLLRLAVGAARERVVLSWPRIDAVLGRPRVHSFYLLDAIRAVEGRLPSSLSPERGDAPVGLAVDQGEHDCSLLEALRDRPASETRGLARHLLDENEHLARALRFRYQRWTQKTVGAADGLVAPGPVARRALARHDLASHPYAPTTLEAFATCPYRFFLRAVQRLEPRAELTPATELDAAVRGRLLHRLLFELMRELAGTLPLRPDALPGVGARLESLSHDLAREIVEELAPPSPRVVDEALAALRIDLLGWLRREAARDVGFVPEHFELSFGLPLVSGRPLERGRDPSSRAEPVVLPIGLRLRGSIDLVERWGGELRARDYKSGTPAVRPGAVVAGGVLLQPVLYALALEALAPHLPGGASLVRSGGVTYVSAKSGYREVEVRLDEAARAAAKHVVDVIAGSLAGGELAARPAQGACVRCAYQVVCGPVEERRLERKQPSRVLTRLREQR